MNVVLSIFELFLYGFKMNRVFCTQAQACRAVYNINDIKQLF